MRLSEGLKSHDAKGTGVRSSSQVTLVLMTYSQELFICEITDFALTLKPLKVEAVNLFRVTLAIGFLQLK